MGSSYEWQINPFQDFLFSSIMFDNDIAKKEFEADIYVGFATIIEHFVLNKNDTQYLDFEIKNNNNYFKVVAKNAISALWISGIFPKNSKRVLETNEYMLENMKYKFNTKTNKLTYRLIKK